ncbi:DNA primase [Alloalcanivorax profundimaris]|uniref:DNA primase n=1 Tax=Alloalcanivorax profundimaris TaxID=2735259 RepID=UPI00188781A7|nr:DNA primase [Alloalcanivorax profundimaris]MBF1802183.1 DNA primase [Alloalcanivorax profundimaris]MCQ6261056.1 DNA primase [Alcanivorax sp. MM125-6]
MAGRIPEHFIQDLLARTDLVALIDSRVPLKKAGRNYSACCPFHQEKTPSFTVAPDKQFYYCFGCGASGNAVGFLMEYDHLSFPEAVEQLATRAGLEVPREGGGDARKEKARRDRLQTLYDLLARAERFYRQQLKNAPERQKAVNYLKGRGLTGQIAARYGLGFAPPGYDNLSQGLSLDNEGIEQALTAGLLVRREDSGRTYDKFRDRIQFPIRDGRGRTIGFGGRVLGDGKPKYLNSPETPVFHKGKELYGLWEWRQSRDKTDRLYVVEGYMDVIALAQHGVPNAVATLGTATSEDHCHLLFRQVNEVVFCFDGDNAGRRAAWRALESALPALDDGKQARFLFLPEGEDPDTLVRAQGPEALLALTDKADTLATYLFRHLSEGLDLNTVDGRARLARLALPFLDKPAGPVYRALLEEELARLTRLERSALEKLRENLPKPRRAAPAPPPTRPEPPPREADPGPWDAPPPDDDPGPPPDWADFPGEAPPARAPRRPARRPAPGGLTLVERLVLVLLSHPEVLVEHPLPEGLDQLELDQRDLLLQVAATARDQTGSPAALLGAAMALDHGESLSALLREALKPPMDADVARRYWEDALGHLRIMALEQALEKEQRRPDPDAARLGELIQALSQARSRARQGPG